MKYMITSEEKPVNHPTNAVHKDLESFVLYLDGGLNDENVQLVQVDEIPEISENFREVLKQEKGKVESTSEPPASQQQKDSEQPEINQGKEAKETKFHIYKKKKKAFGAWNLMELLVRMELVLEYGFGALFSSLKIFLVMLEYVLTNWLLIALTMKQITKP